VHQDERDLPADVELVTEPDAVDGERCHGSRSYRVRLGFARGWRSTSSRDATPKPITTAGPRGASGVAPFHTFAKLRLSRSKSSATAFAAVR
jgi:hypothetical protein